MVYFPLGPIQRVGRVLGRNRFEIQSPMPLEKVITVARTKLIRIRSHRLQCESGFTAVLVHVAWCWGAAAVFNSSVSGMRL